MKDYKSLEKLQKKSKEEIFDERAKLLANIESSKNIFSKLKANVELAKFDHKFLDDIDLKVESK